MTARRSRFGRSGGLVLAALIAAACAHGPPPREPHPLESPPPSADLVGKLSFRDAKAEDTLIDLAPELGVGYVELVAANPGVDPWLPEDGTHLVVPSARLLPSAKREGIIVNLGDLHLYYFEKGNPPRAYPIGIAKDGYATPTGVTQVKAKKEKPTWVPGPSAHAEKPELPQAIPPGPDNPLGEYALYLGWPSYLIHGTNDARGVGRHSSRGCIRLYPADIAALYPIVAIGTPVRVVNEPIKLGWIGGELYLEVNPDADESLELDETAKVAVRKPLKGLRELVKKAAGKDLPRVDWGRVDRTGENRLGIPVRVTTPDSTDAAKAD